MYNKTYNINMKYTTKIELHITYIKHIIKTFATFQQPYPPP